MFDAEIERIVPQMRFLLTVMKSEKTKTPLHGSRRVSKKYKKIHEDYLKIIEQLNWNREVNTLSFEIIINCLEYILKTPDHLMKIKQLKDRLKKQRAINKKLIESAEKMLKIESA